MCVAIIIFMHVLAHDELTKHVPCSLSDYVEAFLMLSTITDDNGHLFSLCVYENY